MPGTLVRNVVNRVRHNSERSEGSSRKVSFNRDVLVQNIPRRSKKDVHEERSQQPPLIPGSDHAARGDAMYNHGVLHPSQQVSDPPKVKRNLVRKIVAQFNEEARLRELLKGKEFHGPETRDHSPYRSRSPPLVEPTPEPASNRSNPFSYTNVSPPKFLHKKSKSEHNLKSPDEVIYAQVVVNGHSRDGLTNKTTVHTKVPAKNGYATKVERNPSMNRHQSMSMSSLQGKSDRYQPVEIRPTMTRRKFIAEGQHQQYHELNRAASPDISYSVSSSPKHQVKDKKRETDYKRVNGEVGREDNRASMKESFFQESVHSVNKDAQNVSMVREKRGGKKESMLKKEKKKEKPDHRDQSKQSQDLHAWDKETVTESKAGRAERKKLDDHRRDVAISSASRQLDNAFDVVDSYTEDKNVRGGKVHSEKTSTRHREEKEIAGGREEMEHRTWTLKQTLNGHSNDTKDKNYLYGYEDDRNATNFKKAELVKEEKVIRRHRPSSSSSSPTRDDSPARRSHRDKSRKEEKREKKKQTEEKRSTFTESSTTLPNTSTNAKESDKKFYYFGANEASINVNAKQPSSSKHKEKVKTKENQALSSTKLVKEANAKVGSSVQIEKSRSAIHSSSHTNRNADVQYVPESPVGSGNQDSGYSSRIGMTSTPRSKSVSPSQHNERLINIEVERHKDQYHHHHHNKNVHRTNYVSSAFVEDNEERMETSESDEIPNQWGFGSQESQASAPSNQWSSLEEEDDEENVVEEHMNTPQSLIREMDKKEISYENSQKSRGKSYNGQLWFERTEIDSDYRRELSSSANTTTADHGTLRNDNHVNNNWGQSATMSRIESNKNRINEDSCRSSTIDRYQNQQQQQQQQKTQTRSRNANSPSTAVRILLNGREITDEEAEKAENSSFRAHQSSRTGSYPSETESQHSNKSKGSRKSSSTSPVSKRVNFKTRSKAKRSVSSAANLSPVHREALMRASSPAHPGSTTGSLNSSGSDASHGSNRSVILHATTVADIPPARSYRYRIYRDSPSPSGGSRAGKSVTRSFSLLAPWKPKKYKQKYERRYNNNDQSPSHQEGSTILRSDPKREKDSHSHNSSSEKLDSLSPLPSEKQSARDKRRVTVSRHNSMPKDTRFTGFFKKKESAPT